MAHFAYDYNPAKTQDYRQAGIDSNKFHAWTHENMYRTSYGSAYSQKPHEPKNNVVPGYGGFVPGMKSKSEFGRSFAQIGKESFSKPDLGSNKFNLSSTGFNLDPKALADPTLTAMSHKYGVPTVQKHHPSLAPTDYLSQTHSAFQDPSTRVNPTYRNSSVDCVNTKGLTKKSGYETNSITFDGVGWLPKEKTNSPRQTTEYRKRFNCEKPIHIYPTVHQPRKLNPFSNTYNVNK